MEIVDGRQTIAVNWIFGYIADERKYNDKVHQNPDYSKGYSS
jgi:hypothetical protein